MIVKMNNKNEKFYNYMGKFFGSRLVQRQTGDRIYDDDDKEWYIYIHNKEVVGFVSISEDVIKNIYAAENTYLKKLLNKLKDDNIIISPSIVTKVYLDIYKESGFIIDDLDNYKNFVVIRSLSK